MSSTTARNTALPPAPSSQNAISPTATQKRRPQPADRLDPIIDLASHFKVDSLSLSETLMNLMAAVVCIVISFLKGGFAGTLAVLLTLVLLVQPLVVLYKKTVIGVERLRLMLQEVRELFEGREFFQTVKDLTGRWEE